MSSKWSSITISIIIICSYETVDRRNANWYKSLTTLNMELTYLHLFNISVSKVKVFSDKSGYKTICEKSKKRRSIIVIICSYAKLDIKNG
jgi:hypothetical protein